MSGRRLPSCCSVAPTTMPTGTISMLSPLDGPASSNVASTKTHQECLRHGVLGGQSAPTEAFVTRVEFASATRAEFDVAADHDEQHRAGRGLRFVAAVERAVKLIVRFGTRTTVAWCPIRPERSPSCGSSLPIRSCVSCARRQGPSRRRRACASMPWLLAEARPLSAQVGCHRPERRAARPRQLRELPRTVRRFDTLMERSDGDE